MLGYFAGIMLVLTALTPFVLTDVFADSIIVDFDKAAYFLGDPISLWRNSWLWNACYCNEYLWSRWKILSANNLEITSENPSKTLQLDSPFYEKPGEYNVKLNYGQISQEHYFSIEDEFVESEIIILKNLKNLR